MMLSFLFSRLLPGTLLIVSFHQAFSQEFEVVELDDFVSPGELRVAGAGQSDEKYSFFSSWACIAADRNYKFRNEFTHATLEYLRSANNYYYDLLGQTSQTSLKVAGVLNDGTWDVPSFKVRVQQALYINTHVSQDYGEQATRFRLSWDIEKRRGRRWTYEYSLGMDVGLELPVTKMFAIGGVVYAWRPNVQKHFLAASALVPVVSWKGGSNGKLGLGVTLEGSSFGEAVRKAFRTINGAVAIEFALPGTLSVFNLKYLPAYNFDRKEWNHEFGAALDVPLITELIE